MLALLRSHAGIFRRPRRDYDDLLPPREVDEVEQRQALREAGVHLARSRRAGDLAGNRVWILYGSDTICTYQWDDNNAWVDCPPPQRLLSGRQLRIGESCWYPWLSIFRVDGFISDGPRRVTITRWDNTRFRVRVGANWWSARMEIHRPDQRPRWVSWKQDGHAVRWQIRADQSGCALS